MIILLVIGSYYITSRNKIINESKSVIDLEENIENKSLNNIKTGKDEDKEDSNIKFDRIDIPKF
ncbi:MAG: hypothetical protein PHH06_05400 [Candidatus Gracilibacteria bacterium]|nr:hypothetical protein [Candidatus Gracilibacteria bacterium]